MWGKLLSMLTLGGLKNMANGKSGGEEDRENRSHQSV